MPKKISPLPGIITEIKTDIIFLLFFMETITVVCDGLFMTIFAFFIVIRTYLEFRVRGSGKIKDMLLWLAYKQINRVFSGKNATVVRFTLEDGL